MLALVAAMGIGRFVYTPILPPMVEALGLTKSQAGLIASANFTGYLAGALLAATPVLGGSRRAWLVGSVAASGLTTAAMAGFSSMVPFALLRFVGGAASAFVLVFASTLVLERLARAGRSGLAAVHFSGVGGGIAVSALVVPAIEVLGGEWRALWVGSGLVATALVLAVARLVPEAPEAPAAAKPDDGGRARGLGALVVAYGLFGFGYVITATFIVDIVRGADDVRAAEWLVWLLVGVAAMPSVAFWTRTGERAGIRTAFALACLVEAFGVAASVLLPGDVGLVLAAVLLGGTFMGLTALGLIGARRLARGDPRRVLGAMTASFGTGQIVGPAFAGAVHDATGSFLVPSLTAVAALVMSATLVFLRMDAGGGEGS